MKSDWVSASQAPSARPNAATMRALVIFHIGGPPGSTEITAFGYMHHDPGKTPLGRRYPLSPPLVSVGLLSRLAHSARTDPRAKDRRHRPLPTAYGADRHRRRSARTMS